MKQPTQIILVEDNREYRDVIRYALEREPQMVLIGIYATAEMALGSLQELQGGTAPDLVLLDLRLPGMSGLEAIPYIRGKIPGAKIMILSQSEDEADVLRAITLGVSGYLLKSSTVQQIKESIRSVMNGGAILDARVARYLINAVKQNSFKVLSARLLSGREHEILELLADGLQKKEISERLHISYTTVDSHVRHIYEKLDVQNAPAAVRKAYQTGIFSAE